MCNSSVIFTHRNFDLPRY